MVVTDSAENTQTFTTTVNNGTYSVDVPTALPEGSYSVTATVEDQAGNSSSATDSDNSVDTTAPTITVNAPDVSNDTTPTITGTTNVPNGTTVTLVVTDSAENTQTFTTTVNNGTYSVDVPTALPEGSYSVTATVEDQAGNSSSATDSDNRIGNHAPSASNATIVVDSVVSGSLPSATDEDGDDVTYAKHTDPSNGSVEINSDGTYTYTPTSGFNGGDSFTYSVNDAYGGSKIYTVFVNVVINDTFNNNGNNVETSGVSGYELSGGNVWSNGSSIQFFRDGYDNGNSAITQTLTRSTDPVGLDVGESTNGAAQIEIVMAVSNSHGASGASMLELVIGDVVYARVTTTDGNSSDSTVEYLNGASGSVGGVSDASFNVSSVGETNYATWLIDLPSDVPSSASLSLRYTSGTGSSDDFTIDNLRVLTTYTEAPTEGNDTFDNYVSGSELDGLGGTDTLILEDGNIDLSNVSNIEIIQLEDSDQDSPLTLTAEDVFDLTDGGNALQVTGEGSVQIDSNEWTKTGGNEAQSVYEAVYSHNGSDFTVTITVDTDLV